MLKKKEQEGHVYKSLSRLRTLSDYPREKGKRKSEVVCPRNGNRGAANTFETQDNKKNEKPNE